jgi:hypothetical protein
MTFDHSCRLQRGRLSRVNRRLRPPTSFPRSPNTAKAEAHRDSLTLAGPPNVPHSIQRPPSWGRLGIYLWFGGVNSQAVGAAVSASRRTAIAVGGQATSGPKPFGPCDRSNFLSALDNADADPYANRRHSEADPRFVELGLVTKPSTSDTMDHRSFARCRLAKANTGTISQEGPHHVVCR